MGFRSKLLCETNGPVHVVKYDTSGQYCLSGGGDRHIRLWNIELGKLISSFDGHAYDVFDIAITRDNERFASCGGDRTVFLWNVSTGQIMRRFKDHNSRVHSVCFNEEGTLLCSASYDKTVKLWDCRSNNIHPLQTLSDAKDSVSSVRLSADCIATGSIDGSLRIYDLRKGQLSCDNLGAPITCVNWTLDQDCLVVTSLDSTIRLINKEDGVLLQKYKSHKNVDYRIKSCLGKNDSCILSGSEDDKLYIWDALTGKVLEVFDMTLLTSERSTSRSRFPESTDSNPTGKDEFVCGTSDGRIYVFYRNNQTKA